MMNKPFFKSKAIVGGFLLAIEAALIASGYADPYVNAAVAFLGVFLTVFGFRDAMADKK